MAQDDIKEEIRARVDLVELIGQYVRLERAGRRFKGLCPFHQEKTPSFFVDPERGFWHCFGCGEGGDVFSFVMRTEGLSFPDAARRLADRVGLAWRTDPQAEERRERRDLLERAHQIAHARFIEHLYRHPAAGRAQDHLRKRGFSRKTLEAFGVGYALESWEDLLKALSAKGIGAEIAEEAGLVKQGERGGHYDVFRDRIMFPICDVSGRTIGFGGRALAADEPAKYLNSPETPLFHKRRTLYGLNLARQAIVSQSRAVVVEGYTDVLSLHQAGLTNVVAGLGTALTREQLQVLGRHCDEVVLVYDADAAGQQAALRNLETFESSTVAVSLIALPEGMDPDDYVREHGAEGLEELLAQRMSPTQYQLNSIFEAHATEGADGRARAAQEAVEVLLKVPDRTRQQEYIARAADRWGGDNPARTEAMARALDLELRRRLGRKGQQRPADQARDREFITKTLTRGAGGAPPGLVKAESDLLKLALDDEQLARRVCEELEPADMLEPADGALLAAMNEQLAGGEQFDGRQLVEGLSEEGGVRARCVELLVGEAEEADAQETVSKAIQGLKEYRRTGGVLRERRSSAERPIIQEPSGAELDRWERMVLRAFELAETPADDPVRQKALRSLQQERQSAGMGPTDPTDDGPELPEGRAIEDFEELRRQVFEALDRGELSYEDPAFQTYQHIVALISGQDSQPEEEAAAAGEPEATDPEQPHPLAPEEAAEELFDVGDEQHGEAQDADEPIFPPEADEG